MAPESTAVGTAPVVPAVTELAGVHVLVAGARVTGTSVVGALTELGARVTVTDANPAMLAEVAAPGVRTLLDATVAPPGTELVVTVPGFAPGTPLMRACAHLGIPVWGDVELAWRADRAELFGPRRRWLAVTGTNGKTTTTTMLESILVADGRRALACGNIGRTVLDALRDPVGFTDLAVELSSFQLHWAPSIAPAAGAVLNVAQDHLDWHGGMEAYTGAKARVLGGALRVVGLDDPVAAALGATVSTPGRTVGFRLGEPAQGEVGYVDGMLVDRAFGPGGRPVELVSAAEIHPGGPPGWRNAAAAAALARAAGVGPAAVAAGLRAHTPGAHRGAVVRRLDGVDWVDDSKATNPHAAAASLAAYPRVVWIAGGLLKGASVDELVSGVAARLVGAVLIGRDRDELARALARHAPEVPVVALPARDDTDVKTSGTDEAGADRGTAVMGSAVSVAAGMGAAGDTVVLAPAAASMDMFTDYAHRGRAFAAAVLALPGAAS